MSVFSRDNFYTKPQLDQMLQALSDALSGQTQTVSDTLSARINSINRSAGRTLMPRTASAVTLGAFFPPGIWVEQGFTVLTCRVLATTAPTGSPITATASINGTVIYTFTLPAGATSSVDSPNGGTGIDIPDASLVTFAITGIGSTTPGSQVALVMSDAPAVVAPPTIGTARILSVTPQAGAFAFTFSYAAVDDNDDLDHFAVRYRLGSTPPASLSVGLAAPDVSPNGQVNNYTVQVTGLSNSATYAFSVFPVGAVGDIGTAGTGTVTTTAPDTTPPGSGTLALQTGTKNQRGGTVVYTPAPTATDFAGITLRESNTTPAPTTITGGRPANSGTGGSGPGLWVPGNGDTSPLFIDITDRTASSVVALSAFPQDTTGNRQLTPATTSWTTSAAPSAGQGAYSLVPPSYAPNYSQDFSGGSATLADFSRDNGWGHQTQGPSEKPDNWTVISEPGNTSNKILRMIGQFITNGYMKPGDPDYNSTWTGGVTSGSGRYGARGNLTGASHIYTYGAWEIRCRVAAPFVNGWKGGTIILWPQGTPSPWPQWEFDLLEIFQGGQRQTNMHFDNGQQNGGQASVITSMDITQWMVVTCMVERANATTGDPIRIRVWFNGGSPVFDTGLPSQSIPAFPASVLTSTKLSYLRTNPQKLQLGFSLAYTQYATFPFGSNPGTQNFDIDSINMWTAP